MTIKTVQDLINRLEKISDKTKPIYLKGPCESLEQIWSVERIEVTPHDEDTDFDWQTESDAHVTDCETFKFDGVVIIPDD